MSYKQLINKINDHDNINIIISQYKNKQILGHYVMINNDGYSMGYSKSEINDLFIFIRNTENTEISSHTPSVIVHHYNYENWYNKEECVYNFIESYTIKKLKQTGYYIMYGHDQFKSMINLYE